MTAVIDFECRSLEQAKALLGDRPMREVCNNTILQQHPLEDCIVLRLHGYEIAQFLPDSRIRLFSHTWYTRTTKNRLNSVLPKGWRLYQEKRKWWLANRSLDVKVRFEEGVEVPPVVKLPTD